MITEADDFFTLGCGRCSRFATPDCSARAWDEGLQTLRELCRGAGLEETVKWGHPCYMHAGRNIAIIGALRGDFRLTFFNAALMQDPAGVMVRQGAATRAPDMISFADNIAPARMAATITAYLTEAKGYAEAGLKPARVVDAPGWPDELVTALDDDPELATAFHALTPGRQKSYVINLNGAKKPETRVARITKFRDKILAGKGALEY